MHISVYRHMGVQTTENVWRHDFRLEIVFSPHDFSFCTLVWLMCNSHCFRAVCLGRLPLICSLNLLSSWLSIAYLGSLNEVHRLDKSLRHPSKYWSRKGLSLRARYWSSTLLLEKFIIISTVLVVEKLWTKNSTKICYRTRKSPLKIMLSMILFFLKWIQVLLLKEKLLKKKKQFLKNFFFDFLYQLYIVVNIKISTN